MQYFSEVLKILEGGLSFNAQTVVNYAQALIGKLEAEGEDRQARLLQAKLDGASKTLAALGAGGSSLPVDQESNLDLGDLEFVSANETHAVLDEHIRTEVQRFLRFAHAADELMAAGVGIAPRMLIYGPPGVGKTQLARHISAELRLPLITARCDSLISSFLGSTAKNIRRLFDHAAARPCVLFLDEFDALAKARDDAQELGELKRVVVGLLQNIDRLPPQCVLLAATNHQQLLDPAVWRRFAYRIHMDLPHSALREALFKAYLRDREPDHGLSYAVAVSEGLSGAAIREACEDVVRETVLVGHERVSIDRLLMRVGQVSLIAREMSPTDEGVVRLLLSCHVPQRMASLASGVSMRQISKISMDLTDRTNGGRGDGTQDERQGGAAETVGKASKKRPRDIADSGRASSTERTSTKTTGRLAKKSIRGRAQ